MAEETEQDADPGIGPPPAPAFYARDGDAFVATAATQGPWSTDLQHGGPVAALLTRALEGAAPPGGHLARVAVDLLRPVPVTSVAVAAQVVRPGRSVALLEAQLQAVRSEGASPRVLARASAWWRRRAQDVVPAVPLPAVPVPGPAELPTATPDSDLTRFLHRGYIAATEYRYAAGHLEQPGPTTAWWRARVPLVAGEATSPTQRALLAADVASGTSAALDFRTHLFSNVDLVVDLLRPPRGDWLLLHAATAIDPAGGGLTSTTLADEDGTFGTAAATLFVRPHAAVG